MTDSAFAWAETAALNSGTIFFAYSVADQHFLYINAATKDILNVESKDIIAQPNLLLSILIPGEEEIIQPVLKELRKSGRALTDFRINVSKDVFKWMSLQCSLLLEDGREIITGTAFDITSLKDNAANIQKFTNKKNSLLEILSHDLLGIFNNIKIATSLLHSYPEVSEDDRINELVNLVATSSDRSVAMINNLVRREFTESAEAALMKERTDIVKQVAYTVEQFRQSPLAGSQTVTLSTDEKEFFVNMDVSKFMQVINNLISNAIKFTPDDGEVSVSILRDADHVVLTVKDTGIGIPTDLQPFIFDKYTAARRPGLKGEPTTGLGMNIIKTIVEWHKGDVWFESREGFGTSIFVRMPIN